MTDQTAEAADRLKLMHRFFIAEADTCVRKTRRKGANVAFWALRESVFRKDADAVATLLADRERLRLVVEKYRAALIDHHQWHLIQTDEDEHGIVPSDAYAESLMCDRTVDALQESAPDPINEAALNTQGEG